MNIERIRTLLGQLKTSCANVANTVAEDPGAGTVTRKVSKIEAITISETLKSIEDELKQ